MQIYLLLCIQEIPVYGYLLIKTIPINYYLLKKLHITLPMYYNYILHICIY